MYSRTHPTPFSSCTVMGLLFFPVIPSNARDLGSCLNRGIQIRCRFASGIRRNRECIKVCFVVVGFRPSALPNGDNLRARFVMMLPVPSQPQRGRFVTFEGLDGCGKSTQLKKLAAVLSAQGMPVVTTREPGGTPTGEKVRQLLLDTSTSALASPAELALMFAARAQHISEIIEPALAEGKIVLCDRFTDSTEAYQGGGRKLGSEPVLALHRMLCGNLWPELTVLMDSDVAASVDRARRRNQSFSAKRGKTKTDENRFEQESRAFFARVRNAYLAIAAREPQRVVVVNARGTPEETHRQIVEVVRRKLKLKQPLAVST